MELYLFILKDKPIGSKTFLRFQVNSRFCRYFSSARRKISKRYFKVIEIAFRNLLSISWNTLWLYFRFVGPNLLLGRTSFSGMFNVVMNEHPFRVQPYIASPFDSNAAEQHWQDSHSDGESTQLAQAEPKWFAKLLIEHKRSQESEVRYKKHGSLRFVNRTRLAPAAKTSFIYLNFWKTRDLN